MVSKLINTGQRSDTGCLNEDDGSSVMVQPARISATAQASGEAAGLARQRTEKWMDTT